MAVGGISACSLDFGVFSEGGALAGGGGDASTGSPTGSAGSGNSGTGAQSSTITTSVGGSSQGGAAAGGQAQGGAAQGGRAQGGQAQGGQAQGGAGQSGQGQGGAPTCAHDPCDEGVPLADGCDPCVSQICSIDSFCCDSNWDYLCTYQVLDVCAVDCAPNLPDCNTQHAATAPSYQFCGQSGAVCDFAFNGTGKSCAAICGDAGTECEEAINNGQDTCDHGQNIGCDTIGFVTAICVCTRGCGNGQPCQPGQTCTSGTCI